MDIRQIEDLMSNSSKILYTAAAAALGAVLSIGGAQANDTAVFRDVLKSHGHERSSSEKHTDGVACGASAQGTIQVIMPAFVKCMQRKGWALDHYVPDPAATPAHGTQVAFTDTRGNGHGQPRGDTALQSDTRACRAGGRDEESASFTRCMAARGWRYLYAQHAPAPRPGWARSSPPSAANLDDDVRHIDEMNRTIQESNDAIAAASAASVAAQQAADQQMQMQNAINSMPLIQQ